MVRYGAVLVVRWTGIRIRACHPLITHRQVLRKIRTIQIRMRHLRARQTITRILTILKVLAYPSGLSAKMPLPRRRPRVVRRRGRQWQRQQASRDGGSRRRARGSIVRCWCLKWMGCLRSAANNSLTYMNERESGNVIGKGSAREKGRESVHSTVLVHGHRRRGHMASRLHYRYHHLLHRLLRATLCRRTNAGVIYLSRQET